ncbi:MAG: HD-GYP domain-containing protein [Geobacter sp.]|nr:MAG: HD-GYP domain-containing protein [Geobacter sp.]
MLTVTAAPVSLPLHAAIAPLASRARSAGVEQLHQFAESLGHAVDARDQDTFNHSWEVAELSRRIALALGLSAEQAETVHLAGHLHDIGKIGVADNVLKKQGALTDREWLEMKRHPEMGAAIIRPVEAFSGSGGIADMVLCHHERFDGGGYPKGLSGVRIPLGARIIAVADTVSAMMQNRPYRKGTTFEAAAEEIKRCAGTQFDPAVVSALLGLSPTTDRGDGRSLPARGGAAAQPKSRDPLTPRQDERGA